jgi:hypothetical protein
MSYNTTFQNVSCAIRAVLLKQEFAHVYCHASIFGCGVIVFIAVFSIVMSHPTSATGNEITEFSQIAQNLCHEAAKMWQVPNYLSSGTL